MQNFHKKEKIGKKQIELGDQLQKRFNNSAKKRTTRNYKLNEMDTLIALYIKACRLDFEIELLFAYNNHSCINEYIYNEILLNLEYSILGIW